MPAKKNDETPGFEASLARLEKIVQEMEDGNMPLDSMITRFEEGQGLLKVCRNKLNEVKKKVEVLVKKNAGFETEALEETSSPDPGELF